MRRGSDELRKIADADDLHFSPFREGRMTYDTNWIWSVAVDGALYVRGYRTYTGPLFGRRPDGSLLPALQRKSPSNYEGHLGFDRRGL